LGVSLEGGYYKHTDKQDNYEQKSSLYHITGGVSYQFNNLSKEGELYINSHVMLGISRLSDEVTSGTTTNHNKENSFHFNIGASLNKRINSYFLWRVLQADYAPTFYYDATQHNYRLSTGLVFLFR